MPCRLVRISNVWIAHTEIQMIRIHFLAFQCWYLDILFNHDIGESIQITPSSFGKLAGFWNRGKQIGKGINLQIPGLTERFNIGITPLNEFNENILGYQMLRMSQ